MKRLFVAVPISPEISGNLRPLTDALRQVKGDFSFVSLNNAHITLKFLGEVEEKQIPSIIQKLGEIASGHTSSSLSVSGVGVFPSLERINVIWVGANSSEMVALMKDVENVLGYIRKNEHRDEIPHITLARVKSAKNKEEIWKTILKYGDTYFGTMTVERMVLFESNLTPQGPVYSIVQEFRLG